MAQRNKSIGKHDKIIFVIALAISLVFSFYYQGFRTISFANIMPTIFESVGIFLTLWAFTIILQSFLAIFFDLAFGIRIARFNEQEQKDFGPADHFFSTQLTCIITFIITYLVFA